VKDGPEPIPQRETQPEQILILPLPFFIPEPKTPKEQGPSKSNTATKREKFVETSNPSGKDEAVRNDLMRKNMVRAHNDSVALMMVEPTKK